MFKPFTVEKEKKDQTHAFLLGDYFQRPEF